MIAQDMLEEIAKRERVSPDILAERIRQGRVVIPGNQSRKLEPKYWVGIGEGLTTKINANLGTSPDYIDTNEEEEKILKAVAAGAHTVMDLSTGGEIKEQLQRTLTVSPVPVGTVPIYQAVCEIVKKGKTVKDLEAEHLFAVIEEQAELGVDFITVHCGITQKTVEVLRQSGRLVGVVSRGGAFLVEWILANKRENPLYADFDRLVSIAQKYRLTLSLGDGLRPGSVIDATDPAQLAELQVLGELVQEARRQGVAVIVEGPGHIPLNEVALNTELEKKICQGAPFYVLGPLVTDVAAGYDHIAGAIGGAIAAAAGADFLCTVSPAEHLRLPTVEDVVQGVIASRIAAQAADFVKGIPSVKEREFRLSRARQQLDWNIQEQLVLFPEVFHRERIKRLPQENNVCTMCGRFCAMKGVKEYL